MAGMSKHAQASLMSYRSHELAAAMSHGNAVSVQRYSGEPVEGHVTHRERDPAVKVDPKDPTSSALVYVIAGVRVPIADVRSVGVPR
jgi:hypothetical protein